MCCLLWLFLCCSLFSQSGQSAGQAFGQQGVYNNMSITVSMAGGSGGVSSLPPMGQPVGMSNSNLSNVGSVCSDQQVSDLKPPGQVWTQFTFVLLFYPSTALQHVGSDIIMVASVACPKFDLRGKSYVMCCFLLIYTFHLKSQYHVQPILCYQERKSQMLLQYKT